MKQETSKKRLLFVGLLTVFVDMLRKIVITSI